MYLSILGTENMTFTEFLQNKFKITGKLLDAIIYAIAIVDKTGIYSFMKFRDERLKLSSFRECWFEPDAYICHFNGSIW